ncbi:hypothetical protein AAF712_010760 [Marasmius tenuissimus]|uniref:Uncharacterized protein n=1 Tax=Marasmius tenuissimus TaxID=585030 RepID=A0ABR2ZN45_9AGAR
MDTIPTIKGNAVIVSSVDNSAVLDIVKVLTGAIFYGIYLLLLVAALNILGFVILFLNIHIAIAQYHSRCPLAVFKMGNEQAKMTLIAALLVMFAMSSFEFWGIVHLCFQNIQIILVNNIDMTYGAKQMVFIKRYVHLGSAIQVMLPLEEMQLSSGEPGSSVQRTGG